MKFTKFLVLLLALSMLLVSCGGNGNGTVTTEPEGTTEAPVDTSKPDFESPYVDGRWIPDSISDYFDSEIERRPSNSDIERIESNMKISKVIEILGRPHRTYDNRSLVWVTDEGDIFGIEFSDWYNITEYDLAIHNFMNVSKVSSISKLTDKSNNGILDPSYKVLNDPNSVLPDWAPETGGNSQFISYKGKQYDISSFKEFKTAFLIEDAPGTTDSEIIIKNATDDSDEFVIQFTPTDYAELYDIDEVENLWVLGTIRGTVDKIYYAGEDTALEEGREITLGIDYGIGKYEDGVDGQDNLYVAIMNYDVTVFRKGYSYIVIGNYKHSDIPLASSRGDSAAFEISRVEDLARFLGGLDLEDNQISLGFVGCSFKHASEYADIFCKILTRFQPVEPAKLND